MWKQIIKKYTSVCNSGKGNKSNKGERILHDVLIRGVGGCLWEGVFVWEEVSIWRLKVTQEKSVVGGPNQGNLIEQQAYL